MAQHNDLGKKGEITAINYLLRKGYTIIEKNYRYLKAEIDIIAEKEDILIAVEVKTRSSNYFGNPEDFINSKKIQLMVHAMDNYIVSNNIDITVQFDIISILYEKDSCKIEHIEDAFLYF